MSVLRSICTLIYKLYEYLINFQVFAFNILDDQSRLRLITIGEDLKRQVEMNQITCNGHERINPDRFKSFDRKTKMTVG